MKKTRWLAALALVGLQALHVSAAAAQYYVDQSSTLPGAGDGSTTNPWKDLQWGISKLKAGDTLRIRNRYVILTPITITKKGAFDARINITTDGPLPAFPNVVCSTARDQHCIKIADSSHVTLSGLFIDGIETPPPLNMGSVALVYLRKNNNVKLIGNRFEHAFDFAVWLDGALNYSNGTSYDRYNSIEDNVFYWNHNTPMYLRNSQNLLVQRNTVDTVIKGDGLVVAGEKNIDVTIDANTVTKVESRTWDGNGRDGIKIRPPSEGVVIQRNHVNTVSGVGIYFIDAGKGNPPLRHKRAKIIDNEVTNAALINRGNNDPDCNLGGWPSALNAAHTDDVLIDLNRVYQNYGEGITLNSVTLGTVTRNSAHDNFGVNFYLNNAADSTVDRNQGINTPGLTAYYRCGAPAGGISMANETGEVPNLVLLTNIAISNNILVNSRFGISYYWDNKVDDHGNPYYHAESRLQNVQVQNNTIYRTWRSALSAVARPDHNNNRIESNIWAQVSVSDPVANLPLTGFACTANLWWATTSSASCASKADVFGDPRFVKAAGSSVDDYKIQSGSPAADAAVYTSVMPSSWHDYFGNTRRQGYAWDIGAHER